MVEYIVKENAIDALMLANARLFQKIGEDARKYRFEIRQLPKERCQ